MQKLLSFLAGYKTPSYNKNIFPIIGVIVLVIVLTSTIFIVNNIQNRDVNTTSHASAINNSVEIESGTLVGSASLVNDSSASGGQYVLLGSQGEGIYPYGNKFGLGLYALNQDWQAVAANGWNICQTYSTNFPNTTYTNNCKNAGLLIYGRLPSDGDLSTAKTAKSESAIATDIADLLSTNDIGWWDMPEELRYWKPTEMDILKNYPLWIRKYDTKKLPIQMYIPGHYGSNDIKKYVPYLDILPASAYDAYMGLPHTYVRWSIERTFQAIRDAGYTIGKDYLNGQKTVTSILEIFQDKPGMSPEGSNHDFWLSVALDVKAISIYAYAYRNVSANMTNCWNAYNTAVSNFTGPEHLDKVMINGTTNPGIGFTITSGPQRTDAFTPPSGGTIDYPSLTVLSKNYDNKTYVISVNSNTAGVTANITGLPTDASNAEVLFENRSVDISAGSLSDTFNPLGVHIYRIN